MEDLKVCFKSLGGNKRTNDARPQVMSDIQVALENGKVQ